MLPATALVNKPSGRVDVDVARRRPPSGFATHHFLEELLVGARGGLRGSGARGASRRAAAHHFLEELLVGARGGLRGSGARGASRGAAAHHFPEEVVVGAPGGARVG